MRQWRLVLLGVMVLGICTAAPASAQIGFGIEGGITRSSLYGDDATDLDSRTGAMGGIWFGGNRNGILGLMGELTYVVKGANEDESELKLHYLEIPALLRLNIGAGSASGVRVYGLVGPVLDIKLKSELDGVDDDQFEDFDMGIMAGGGIEAARIGFEVRGNWGLRDLFKDATGLGDETDAKNFVVQILLKFRIS